MISPGQLLITSEMRSTVNSLIDMHRNRPGAGASWGCGDALLSLVTDSSGIFMSSFLEEMFSFIF